jgi:hypothetical protein
LLNSTRKDWENMQYLPQKQLEFVSDMIDRYDPPLRCRKLSNKGVPHLTGRTEHEHEHHKMRAHWKEYGQNIECVCAQQLSHVIAHKLV